MTTRQIGSPNATIRQTAAQLGVDTSRDHAADHLRLLASGPPSLQVGAFSVPTYPAARATATARVYQLHDIAQQQTMIGAIGTEIPWNPAWMPSADTAAVGGDRIVNIVDFKTGIATDLWMLRNDNWARFIAGFHLPNVSAWRVDPTTLAPVLDANGQRIPQVPYNAANPNHILCGSLSFSSGSIFTAEDHQMGGQRGCGQFKQSCLIRGAEILEGRLGHKVPWTVSNPAYGVMTDGVLATPEPHRGPAFRLEHRNPGTLNLGGVTPNPPPNEVCLASGMSMAHDLTRLELTAIASRWATRGTALFATLMVLGVAHGSEPEYGFGGMAVETGGYGVGEECDGWWNPASRSQWHRAGVVTTAHVSRVNGFLGELFNQPGRWFTLNQRFITNKEQQPA